jgi:MoaA/NifB/PqqE/SkfB family radical SAM enzyme
LNVEANMLAPLIKTVAAAEQNVALPAGRVRQFLTDIKNFVLAAIAVHVKSVYLPSLFGHYTVNSACNLRCAYCYVGQPEIFPTGFTQTGLPLDRAKRVLVNLRKEVVALRIQGGEPFLYRDLTELVRFAKRDLRFWHVSIITNGLALAKDCDRFQELFRHISLLTLSIDETRVGQYPEQMQRLAQYLPELAERCRRHRVTLTRNYTATWEELARPEQIRVALDKHRAFFRTTYIMPVRQAGKTPLPLLKNSTLLNRRYSVAPHAFPDYPEWENVRWYIDHCDPKLKIKVDALGGLVFPCENHSYSAGSLEDHSIRELWNAQLTHYPNESCLGCGKQRFRSHLLKHPTRLVNAAIRVRGRPVM